MWGFVLKLALGKVLTSPDVKKQVMDQLAAAAKKTDTKLDDEAVQVFGEVWDVVVPIVVGKAG